MKAILLAGVAATSVLIATAAAAQANPPAPASTPPVQPQSTSPTSPLAPEAATPADSSGLQDIVVTAQRRSENLQRAALAISAVTGDALTKAGVTKPTELTSVVPALQVAPSAGPYAIFYLRGVGNFNGNALSDSAIAFNFDGVYIGRPSGTTGYFYDLDRVEVLKGPQGTLYGRNATGGAINVISRKPDLGRFGFEGTADLGNYNAAHIDAAVNIPLGDRAALRAAGTYVKHDGYMKDGTDDQDDVGGRLSLRVEPTSKLTINVVGDYFHQRGVGVGGTPVQSGIDNRYGYLSPQTTAFLVTQPNVVLGTTFKPFTTAPYMDNSQWGIAATIDWRTPVGTLTIVPAHREASLNYRSVTPGFYLWSREKDRQTSVEARLASDDTRPIRYLLGAFYYNETNDIPFYNINQQSNFNLEDYIQKGDSKAVFGRLTYAIMPSVRITAGVRYSHETKDFAGEVFGALKACVLPTSYFPTYVPGCPTATAFPVTPMVPPANFVPGADGTATIPLFIDNKGRNAKSLSVDKVTYRASADWDITSRNLLYASFETGFKSGGFFLTSDAGTFKPEKIQAWTIGSKNRFFDNRLQLNIEGFYWRYNDQQISHLVSDSGGNVVFATENVGRATYKGVEVESRFLLTKTTELNADVQYLDAKYNSFVYQTPNVNGGVDNGTSCPNVGTPGASYTVNCSGKRPPFAPKWTLNIGATQTIPLASSGRIVGSVRGHYQSTSLTGLEFLPQEFQAGYWMMDGDLAYIAPGDKFSVTAYVNNAFDKAVIANTFPVPFSFFTSASVRPPRTFGVRFGMKF